MDQQEKPAPVAAEGFGDAALDTFHHDDDYDGNDEQQKIAATKRRTKTGCLSRRPTRSRYPRLSVMVMHSNQESLCDSLPEEKDKVRRDSTRLQELHKVEEAMHGLQPALEFQVVLGTVCLGP